jgi:Fic family protein
MANFGYKYGYMANINSLHITPEILAHIAEIEEFKGAWKAIGRLAPERLQRLQKVATIESIGSSTRIEGSKLSDAAVERLLQNIQIQHFESRDEQEVAGYGSVMQTLFEHHQNMSLSESLIKHLHRDLLRFSQKDEWHRGSYKQLPNHVEAFDADGKSMGIVFETANPFDTIPRMQQLLQLCNDLLSNKSLHPLLVNAIFTVEFLAIHPFQDGNGRLSRILTNLLLLQAGYMYTPYSSLEAVIEQHKQGYYLALRQTQSNITGDAPDWNPWVLFFLKALRMQQQNLLHKIEQEQILISKLPVLSMQIVELAKARGRITIGEINTLLVEANRATIKKHLAILVAQQHLQQYGSGKGTSYGLA